MYFIISGESNEFIEEINKILEEILKNCQKSTKKWAFLPIFY